MDAVGWMMRTNNSIALQAGVAEAVMPSQPGLDLAGYVARDNPSRDKHDDIFVRALVLRSGDCLLLLLAADVVGFAVSVSDAIRAETTRQAKEALPADAPVAHVDVMLAATHTHSAPASMPLRGCGEVNEAWLQSLGELLAQTARRAVEELQPARLGSGMGAVRGIAGNRRAPDWKRGGNAPAEPVDTQLGVLRVETTEGATLACLINFACHPVVLGEDNLAISADYPGAAARRLGHHLGAVVLFANGACGDINPTRGGSWAEVDSLADAVAAEAQRVWPGIQTTADVPLAARSRRITLPLLPLPPRDELESLAQQFRHERESADHNIQRRIAEAYQQWAEAALSREREAPPHQIEIQALRLGEAALIAVPGELFVELGLQIKQQVQRHLAASGLRQVMVAGYANGNIGYIPTRAAYSAGGYEVETAHRFYGHLACVAPEAGEEVVATAVALAREAFGESLA